MESYTQPWTVVEKCDKHEPKTHEWFPYGENKNSTGYKYWQSEKPEHLQGEKPQYWQSEKPQYWQGEKPEHWQSGKPQWLQGERPQYHYKGEKSEYYYKGEKPEHWQSERPQCWQGEKTHYLYKGEKPEYYKQIENICGEWEKICDNLERLNVDKRQGDLGYQTRWQCSGNQRCCDDEFIGQIKQLIGILIGAEQSYIQLGFLCMDEKFTLVNTSEYFRLCGLRMRWLANAMIGHSVRLFNVNEWINNTTFENFFKVPSKEELATNDYTSILKTIFKIAIEAENRLVEHMNVVGDKIMKTDWINTQCRFDGSKWFVNFVLPYQTHFVREINTHFRNVEMCNNGFVFDKCEMYPLVQKIEEFINRLVKINTLPWNNWTLTGKVNTGLISKKW